MIARRRAEGGVHDLMVSNGTTTPASDGGATRRNVLKGATAAVGAFIAFEAIGGVSLAAGASPKTTALSNGVIYPDPTLCIGCLTCEVICSQVHKEQGLSDLPRIRIFNDPNTKVDPEVLAAYPGPRLVPPGAVPAVPDRRMPVRLPGQCVASRTNHRRAHHPRGRVRRLQSVRRGVHLPDQSARQNATNQLNIGQESRISYDPVKDSFTKCDLCYWRDEGGPARCAERCPVNIRIRQGILKSRSGACAWTCPRSRTTRPGTNCARTQTFEGAPAQTQGLSRHAPHCHCSPCSASSCCVVGSGGQPRVWASGTQPWGQMLGDNFLFARALPFTLGLGVSGFWKARGALAAAPNAARRTGAIRRFARRARSGCTALAAHRGLLGMATGGWQYLKGLLDVTSPVSMAHGVPRPLPRRVAADLRHRRCSSPTGGCAAKTRWACRKGSWIRTLRGLAHELPRPLGDDRSAICSASTCGAPPRRPSSSRYYERADLVPDCGSYRIGLIMLTGIIKAMRYIYPIPGDILYWVSAIHVGAGVLLAHEVARSPALRAGAVALAADGDDGHGLDPERYAQTVPRRAGIAAWRAATPAPVPRRPRPQRPPLARLGAASREVPVGADRRCCTRCSISTSATCSWSAAIGPTSWRRRASALQSPPFLGGIALSRPGRAADLEPVRLATAKPPSLTEQRPNNSCLVRGARRFSRRADRRNSRRENRLSSARPSAACSASHLARLGELIAGSWPVGASRRAGGGGGPVAMISLWMSTSSSTTSWPRRAARRDRRAARGELGGARAARARRPGLELPACRSPNELQLLDHPAQAGDRVHRWELPGLNQ